MSDFTFSVTGCARCGGDHVELAAVEFQRPPKDEDEEWSHWATCPETGEPILIVTPHEKHHG
jgi:hypothetical protein